MLVFFGAISLIMSESTFIMFIFSDVTKSFSSLSDRPLRPYIALRHEGHVSEVSKV